MSQVTRRMQLAHHKRMKTKTPKAKPKAM